MFMTPTDLLHKPKLALLYPIVVFLLSFSVLLGWVYDIESLRQMLSGSVSMNPMTAILFICCALVITLNIIFRHRAHLTVILASVVLLTGLFKLFSYAGIFDFELDKFLFNVKLKQDNTGGFQNEMAPNTALNFFLLGSAFLFYRVKSRINLLSDCFCLIVAFTSFLSIVGYLYDANELYGLQNYIPMALPTAICFLLISIATLLNRKESFIVGLLSNKYSGTKMATYLLPIAIILPVFLGLLRLYGQRAGFFSGNFGTALFAAVNTIIFIYFILKAAISINKSDEALHHEIIHRKEIERELRKNESIVREFNRELEKQVEERTNEVNDKQLKITQATILGQEKERKEIGMELHDNVNQILAACKLYLDMIASKSGSQEELVDRSRSSITHAINEIRKLTKALVPPPLGSQAIVTAIKEFAELIQESSGLKIDLHIPKEIMDTLDEHEQLALYRIIQEQLHNIVKHSGAKRTFISLKRHSNCAILNIGDDGKGFTVDAKKPGIGLSNIKSRVEMLRGKFEIQSAPGEGCRLTIELPCNN